VQLPPQSSQQNTCVNCQISIFAIKDQSISTRNHQKLFIASQIPKTKQLKDLIISLGNMAAAVPILASSLWSTEQEQSSTTAPQHSSPLQKHIKLAIGCPSIDDTLHGGFDYGSITCISAEAESGAKDLSDSLIAAHLLTSRRAEATVVDTTNSFDVRRLHKRLVAGLTRDGRNGGTDGDVRDEAVRVLERTRIMKAFDFVGLTECVAELRQSLEMSSKQAPSPRQQAVPAPRGTVGDSEDEEEEEMLDAPTPPSRPVPPEETRSDTEVQDRSSHLLIIDNITYVTSPVLKNSHIQGQALLTSFMRSLAHVTQRHSVCTIIHNTAVTYSNANANANTNNNTNTSNNTSNNNNNNNSTTAEPTPSIFASCALRPALGKTFPYLLDLHLLLHKLPISTTDAKAVYAAHGAIPKPENKLASVLEVMHDRYSDRVGHWSAFRVDPEGNLISVSA